MLQTGRSSQINKKVKINDQEDVSVTFESFGGINLQNNNLQNPYDTQILEITNLKIEQGGDENETNIDKLLSICHTIDVDKFSSKDSFKKNGRQSNNQLIRRKSPYKTIEMTQSQHHISISRDMEMDKNFDNQ